MKKKSIILMVIFMVLAVLSAVYVVALRTIYRTWIQPLQTEIRVATAKNLPLFLDDQKAIEHLREIIRYKGTKDAGPYLNKIIPSAYKSPQGEISEAFQKFHQTISGDLSPKTLPKKIVEQLDKDKKEAITHFRAFDLTDIDFRWMKDLRQFDYWETMQNSPAGFLSGKNIFVLNDVPIPNFLYLQRWAKLRLIKGLQDKQITDALAEVRHLAILSCSTELLIGEMICHAILTFENEAYHVFLKENPGENLVWEVIGKDDLKVLKRVLLSYPGFVYLLAEPEEIDQVLRDQGNLGICGGIQEGLILPTLYRPLLKDRFKPFYLKMDSLLQTSSCRLPLIRKFWKEAKTSKVSWEKLLEFKKKEGKIKMSRLEYFSFMPVAKPMMGEFLMTISIPNWFGLYDQNEIKK